MPHATILLLHILGLFVTVGVGLYALYAVACSKSGQYRGCALVLGFVAAFEVCTGTALALLSAEVSAAGLSMHIALYLGACLGVELLLFARIKKMSGIFPVGATASPVFASLCFFIAALSYNF